jgi:hypothetical protein
MDNSATELMEVLKELATGVPEMTADTGAVELAAWAAAEEVVDIEIGRMDNSATELMEVLKELATGVPETTADTGAV